MILEDLADWRTSSSGYPVLTWSSFLGHIHSSVNPLASEDHAREILQQLQLMGEVGTKTFFNAQHSHTPLFQVIFLKGSYEDFLILDPDWLCNSICGHLLSRGLWSKLEHKPWVDLPELKDISQLPHLEELLPLLEALGICCRARETEEVKRDVVKSEPIHQTYIL